jgi:hypothetical protein
MTATVYLWGTRDMGRYATRVEVVSGAFAGKRGVVVKVIHAGCALVRLDCNGQTLPFGPTSELKAVR